MSPSSTLQRAQRGEIAARQALVEAHGRIVWGLCGRFAREAPEDAYQAIWEKAFVALPRFQGDLQALPAWLRAIAHHHFVDLHRRRAVRGEAVSLEHAPPDEPSAHRLAQSGQELARLRHALDRLPEAQRRAVVFHYLDEVPLAALAEREEVPVNTLKSRLHQARARLLQLLVEEEP